jgi:hypothetical protein
LIINARNEAAEMAEEDNPFITAIVFIFLGIVANLIGQAVLQMLFGTAIAISSFSPVGGALVILIIVLFAVGDAIELLEENAMTVIGTLIVSFASIELLVWAMVGFAILAAVYAAAAAVVAIVRDALSV